MTHDISQIIEKIDNLPQNFYVALKVAKMLDDFNVSIDELSEIISIDQALTSKLLKLCNSAEYGFSRKVHTVKDAVSKIGFKTLKSIIFMLVSKGSLTQELSGYSLEKGDLWRNSISCAVFSRYLAEASKYNDVELAFTAGLLRDIGKLLLHHYVKEKYDEIVSTVTTEEVSFSEAEKKVIGFNHSQIGAMAANKWKFPTVLVDAISYHHVPQLAVKNNCDDIKLVHIVHVADAFSSMLGSGIGNDSMMYQVDVTSLEQLGFEPNSSSIEYLFSELSELNSEVDSLIASIN